MFQQVVIVDERDTLCGKPIIHGEKLILRWPDSSSSSHAVIVVESSTNKVIKDGRKKIPLVRSEASVLVKHRGHDLRVYLANSGLFVARDE